MKKFFLLTPLLLYYTFHTNYIEIPDNAIRIRIIPSSNSTHDKEVKYLLKNNINKIIYPIVRNAKDEEEAQRLILNSLPSITKKIQIILDKNSIDEKFSTSFGLNYFPEKHFNGLTYKSGEYNSLVIKLGDAKGDNYWCVLYPPLCLVDENKTNYEYHFLIKDVIDKYN